ncbi:MAG: hypothetical protein VKL20_08945 [Synechocystis sp.]|nr:hypothetical protein [Synechocystis sp.]
MGEFGNKDDFFEDDLGMTLHLPINKIKGNFNVHKALLNNLVSKMKEEDSGKNFLPIIVEKESEKSDFYKVILNGQILEAARKANLDFVWCIIIDQPMLEQIKVESGELRLSVQSATEEMLTEALDYINQTTPRAKINTKKAAKLIIDKRDQGKLCDFKFLTNGSCGIGDVRLNQVSQCLLIEQPTPKPIPKQILIQSATEEMLTEALDYINQTTQRAKIDTKKAAKLIIEKRDKSKLKDLNFLKQSKCGIGNSTFEKINQYLLLDKE